MKKTFSPLLASTTLLLLTANPASATIFQGVELYYNDGSSGHVNSDKDAIVGNTEAEINRALLASISSPPGVPQYSATGSIGEFGNYGLSGGLTTGVMQMKVLIADSNIANLTGRAQNVEARFIVDGGTAGLIQAPGARITYNLQLSSSLGTPSTPAFHSYGELNNNYTGGSYVTTFSSGGNDIGAVFDGKYLLDIPVSFQTAHLGVLNPNQSMSLSYSMQIEIAAPNYAEGAFMQFQDPLQIPGFPANRFRPSVTFTPVGGPSEPVALPGSLLLLLPGVLLLAHRKRTTAKT